MEPHAGGQTQEPLDNDVQGLPDFGHDWGIIYSGNGSGSLRIPEEAAAEWIDNLTDSELLAEAGIEPIVSTSEAAEYFGRTSQWIYWGLTPDRDTKEIRFVYPDGTPIVPERINGNRRFTMPILRAILQSCYRRGNISEDELKTIIRRIRCTELGLEWRKREGWKYCYMGRNRYRWIKPENAYLDPVDEVWKVSK